MITTQFRDEIVAALKQGAQYGALLAVVVQHKTRGLGQREAYDTLESVWAELGCREAGEDPTCEALEDLMDRVWGFSSPVDAIWETTLSE